MTAWEQDVIRQVRAGDRAAYGRLVEKYQDSIRHSVARIAGGAEGARDVTQDAFLAAYEHLDSFDASRSFFSWLYGIAHNRAVNCGRRQHRQCPLPEDSLRAPDCTPEERVLAQEREAQVFRSVGRLPPAYLAPLVLRLYLDCSYREIGELLGLPRATVRSRMCAARKLLAAQLGG